MDSCFHHAKCPSSYVNLYFNFVEEERRKDKTSHTETLHIFFSSTLKLDLVKWLQDVNIISKSYTCPRCKKPMNLKKICNAHSSSDEYASSCGRREGRIKHNVSRSIRKGTWLQNSNLTIQEILSLTYFWATNSSQITTRKEVSLSEHTVVDWFTFCREVCFEICIKNGSKIGGYDVIVEIDEAKLGKENITEGNWLRVSGFSVGVKKMTVKIAS